MFGLLIAVKIASILRQCVKNVHVTEFADLCLSEIFLPSYADYHFDDLERRQDPVQDIILTDEEIKNMFPS